MVDGLDELEGLFQAKKFYDFLPQPGHINNAAPWRHKYFKKTFFTKAGEQQEQRNGANLWGTYTWWQSYQVAVGIVHR